ncbi:MAG: hypothetical protein HYU63_09335 [Armatimonadetes bacterium]|nr:hypothetical protein [Armatimonadota bacterium]
MNNNFEAKRISGLFWSLQLVSGVVLTAILILHFWVLHYTSKGELTYDKVAFRISHPIWKAIDLLFLVLALYHGLNGLRAVLLDFGLSKSLEKFLFWSFSFLALILFLFGYQVIMPLGK